MAEPSTAIVSLSIVLLTGILAGRFADEFNFPRTIPLILTGILIAIISNIGIVKIVIDISAIRDMAILTAELALIAVLFKEGMHLNLRQFRKHLIIIVLIATFGTVLTTLIVGIAVFSFNQILINFPLTLAVAILIGAIFTPTDPAATFSTLRGGGEESKIDEKFETILGGESALNDVIAIILVVVILIPSAIDFTGNQGEIQLPAGILLDAAWQFIGGLILGFIIGYFILLLINSLPTRTEESMVTLAGTVLIFGLGFVLDVNSAIGALLAGIVIGNPKFFKQPSYSHKEMSEFWENLTFLFEILAFVFIGAIFSLSEFNFDILLFSILLSIIVMVGRFAGIFVITSILELSDKTKEHLNNRQRMFLGFAGMKGLTTGILAILAYIAFQGSASGIGQIILYSSILVLIFTGLIQGIFLKDVAKKCGVIDKFDEVESFVAEKIALRAALDYLIKEYEMKNINTETFTKIFVPLKDALTTLEEKFLLKKSEITDDKIHFETAMKMNEHAIKELEKSFEQGEIKNDIAFETALNRIYDSNKALKNKFEHLASSESALTNEQEEKVEQSIIELDHDIDKADSTFRESIKTIISSFQKSVRGKK
jgi:NhaP-type Na+/H+ or K+/H+ antiporter